MLSEHQRIIASNDLYCWLQNECQRLKIEERDFRKEGATEAAKEAACERGAYKRIANKMSEKGLVVSEYSRYSAGGAS